MNPTTNTAHGSSSSGQTLRERQRRRIPTRCRRHPDHRHSEGVHVPGDLRPWHNGFYHASPWFTGCGSYPQRYAAQSRDGDAWGKSPRRRSVPLQMLAASLVVAYRVSWATARRAGQTILGGPNTRRQRLRSRRHRLQRRRRFARVTTGGPIADPVVGQTVAVFDRPNKTFRAKRIETVTIITPGQEWQLTCSTVNLASDTTYTPIAASDFCPIPQRFAELIVEPTLTFVDGFGPGEMYASFVDPGLRQRRNPPNPDSYPSTVTNKLVSPILALPSISNAVVLEPTIPHTTPIGTPARSCNLLELTDLAVYGE